jgi:hypothetical protein
MTKLLEASGDPSAAAVRASAFEPIPQPALARRPRNRPEGLDREPLRLGPKELRRPGLRQPG